MRKIEIWNSVNFPANQGNMSTNILKRCTVFHVLLRVKLILKECNICKSFVLHMATRGLRQKKHILQELSLLFPFTRSILRNPLFNICETHCLSPIISKAKFL